MVGANEVNGLALGAALAHPDGEIEVKSSFMVEADGDYLLTKRARKILEKKYGISPSLFSWRMRRIQG